MILRPVLFFFARAPASGSGQSIKGMINGSGCQSTRARVPRIGRYPETSVPAVCPDRAGPFMKQDSAAKAPAPGYVMPVILVKFPDDLIDMFLSHARGLPSLYPFPGAGNCFFQKKMGVWGLCPQEARSRRRPGPGSGTIPRDPDGKGDGEHPLVELFHRFPVKFLEGSPDP